MKLFNSMVKKAEILEEARKAQHAAIFDLSLITAQLKDKKLGVPYRDARRFWYDWARETQIWPEGIPADAKTPADAKSINAIIGAYVTSDKFKPESEQQWQEYVKDPKHIEQFFGMTRATRAGKRGVDVATSEQDIKALSPEEIAQRKEDAKKQKTVDTGKVDIAELKLKVLPKFDNPRMKQYLVNFALDNEVDSETEAENLADDAIETVADAFRNAQSIDEILNNLETIQSTGTPTAADLAEAAFNYIKKIVTVEDEEASTPTKQPAKPMDKDIADLATPDAKERAESVYGTKKYVETFEKVSAPIKKLIVETTRQKFKPKNIHQLIQQQYDRR